MKYYVWDNDNAVLVCATHDRKAAFTAILTHLIECSGSEETEDPIMWPVESLLRPEKQMPEVGPMYDDCRSLIRQAQTAYDRITGLIPMSLSRVV